jgi:hypothetical protein
MHLRNKNLLDPEFPTLIQSRGECERIHGRIKASVTFHLKGIRHESKILEDALTGMSVSPISEEKSAESKRKGFRMLDDKDGWEEFIKTRNKDKAAKSTASFVITAPLRHDQDVHDHLTVV